MFSATQCGSLCFYSTCISHRSAYLCRIICSADKQKTGPGRKSNAEHAIAFYEYVLETITEEKEEKQQKEGALGDPPAAIEKPQEEKPKKRGRGRPPKKKREEDEEKRQQSETGGEKDKKKEEKSEDDNSESVESMDTAEFISQHNDLCEVCNMPGELLMCNTCNLVFHLDCVRPKLEGIPPGKFYGRMFLVVKIPRECI